MAQPGFTQAQLTAFFTNVPQMALSVEQRDRLAQEGLILVDDFVDFKDDQLDQAAKNMRTSIPGRPAQLDANGVVLVAAVPAINPVLISARCMLRLKVASIAYHYYESIERAITPANMNYTRVLRGFYQEWEALCSLAKEDKPDVPVLSKNVTPIKWLESFKDTLSRTFGVRKAPLSYVIRDNVQVPTEVDDPLQASFAFSATSGSVLNELERRMTQTHPLFRTDNATVFSMLEEATRSTIYAPTIKPFTRLKNGRGAFQALVSSHAGKDKWEKMQKDKLSFLTSTKWNGRQYSLEKFTNLHRSGYVQLEECQLHVDFQLPTEHTRVGFLIDNITNPDPDLRAALGNIRLNTQNMRDDFEAAVTYLLPVCPYNKNKATSSKGNNKAHVSDVTLKGKHNSETGVDLRWHTKKEYAQLSSEQKKELYEWQQTKDGKSVMNKSRQNSPTNANNKKSYKAQIKALKGELKASKEKETTTEEIAAAISTAFANIPEPKANASSATVRIKPTAPPAADKVDVPTETNTTYGCQANAAAVAIKGILKRKRDESSTA